jgi:hypothetical protein
MNTVSVDPYLVSFFFVMLFLHRLFVEGRIHCGLTGFEKAGEKTGGASETNARTKLRSEAS